MANPKPRPGHPPEPDAAPRVLLLLPASSYRGEAFREAAAAVGAQVTCAADYCHVLAPGWGVPALQAVHFDRAQEACAAILRELDARPDAVIAVDDNGVELAAALGEALGLPANAPAAVGLLRDKHAFREMLRAREFPCPGFRLLASAQDAQSVAREIAYPAVVKARRLASGRGVLRADTPEELVAAVARVREIQRRADRDAPRLGVLVEDFIPGSEHALEGLLVEGRLETLALFDKPDPMDGPAFEETLLVTPSRLPAAVQAQIESQVARACRAAGLNRGPVHAEVRVNADGVWLLEIAPRSIGGLCGRSLTNALGMTLEEVILREALGLPLPAPSPGHAAAVMMLPIPRRGIFRGARGLAAARRVAGVTEVRITVHPGERVAPPPEGAGYLGFLFAKGGTPQEAEAAARAAHRLLRLSIVAEHPLRAAQEN